MRLYEVTRDGNFVPFRQKKISKFMKNSQDKGIWAKENKWERTNYEDMG